MYDNVCFYIMRLYLYADMVKMIHYSTDKSYEHELCDKVRDCIIDFTDSLAEQYFGIEGKPSFSDFSFQNDLKDADNIGKICSIVNSDITTSLKKMFERDEKYSGIVSLIDDFKGEIAKYNFLSTFDNISNTKL